MRKFILLWTLVISLDCLGQQTIKGQVLSIVDSTPIPNKTIRVDNKQIITTDLNGVFTVSPAKRKIRLTVIPYNINLIDTVFLAKSITSPIKLYAPVPIDSALARFDIEHNRVRLFCGGGIAPLAPMPSDKDFENLFAVKYHYLDCAMPDPSHLNAYNQVVADFLDKRYGAKWRQKVRPDVFSVTKETGR